VRQQEVEDPARHHGLDGGLAVEGKRAELVADLVSLDVHAAELPDAPGKAEEPAQLAHLDPAGPLARFLAAFVRYSAHVSAFLYLVANPFPGFVGAAGSYPVDVDIAPPGRQNRWITCFRILLALPALFLSSALGWVGLTASFLTWFYALVCGRAPAGLQRTGAYVIGYSAQLNCYLYTLTDRYPHSSPLVVLRR